MDDIVWKRLDDIGSIEQVIGQLMLIATSFLSQLNV